MQHQSVDDLIRHFRRKAHHYAELADAIEKEARELEESGSTAKEDQGLSGDTAVNAAAHVRTGGTATIRLHRPRTIGLPTGEPTLENIRGYLAQKRARPRDLAMHFKVEEGVIRRIVSDPLNRITVGDRGWLKLDQSRSLTLIEEERPDWVKEETLNRDTRTN